MTRWTCPNCNRVFGKVHQSHLTCEPALTLDEYFAQARPFEEPIFRAVHDGIGGLDGLIIDPIGIGILLKNGPMFAELRPKTKWTAVGFSLGRKLETNRLSRKVVDYGKKYFHVINIDDPKQIDDQIIEWLTEAYHLAGGTLAQYKRSEASMFGASATNSVSDEAPRPRNGMVPDDVDDLF